MQGCHTLGEFSSWRKFQENSGRHWKTEKNEGEDRF